MPPFTFTIHRSIISVFRHNKKSCTTKFNQSVRNATSYFPFFFLVHTTHSARQLKSGQGNLSAFSISNAKTSSVQPRPLPLISRGLIVDTCKTYQYLNSRSSSLEGFTMNWRKRSHFFCFTLMCYPPEHIPPAS